MISAEALGLIAGALSTLSLVPQLVRVFRRKSAQDLSLPFTSLFLAGVLLWLVYGIFLRLSPVILWNAVGATLMVGLIIAKLRYGRKPG